MSLPERLYVEEGGTWSQLAGTFYNAWDKAPDDDQEACVEFIRADIHAAALKELAFLRNRLDRAESRCLR